jgi:cellulose synthase/poly-beta-1,6-N-acetylglucosamine synthase-like glycosyltransferase
MNLWISLLLLAGMIAVTTWLAWLDARRRRPVPRHLKLSFLIPCYNDCATIGATLRSLREATGDRHEYEILVADDASRDGSREQLRAWSANGGFRLFENAINMGKSQTLNRLVREARHDLLIFVDADTLLHAAALDDLLARLTETDNVGAVSCPYRPLNRGAWAQMQALDYSMIRIVQGSYNWTSGLALWGGCLGIRKAAFTAAGGFSVSAITEDVDMAHKLNQLGWKVQQSMVAVASQVPDTLKSWSRQKMRWTSGVFQCLVKYPRVWIKNPIHVALLIGYGLMSVYGFITLLQKALLLTRIWRTLQWLNLWLPLEWSIELLEWWYRPVLLQNLHATIAFVMLSAVYVVPLVKNRGQAWKLLLIVPFSFLYFPLYALASTLGILGFILRSCQTGPEQAEVRAW